MNLDHPIERKAIKSIGGLVTHHALVNGQVGAVEQEPCVCPLGDPGEEIEQVQISDKSRPWGVFREHLVAGGFSEPDDALGQCRGAW